MCTEAPDSCTSSFNTTWTALCHFSLTCFSLRHPSECLLGHCRGQLGRYGLSQHIQQEVNAAIAPAAVQYRMLPHQCCHYIHIVTMLAGAGGGRVSHNKMFSYVTCVCFSCLRWSDDKPEDEEEFKVWVKHVLYIHSSTYYTHTINTQILHNMHTTYTHFLFIHIVLDKIHTIHTLSYKLNTHY